MPRRKKKFLVMIVCCLCCFLFVKYSLSFLYTTAIFIYSYHNFDCYFIYLCVKFYSGADIFSVLSAIGWRGAFNSSLSVSVLRI